MHNLPTPPPPVAPYVRQYGPKPLPPEQRKQQILFKVSHKNKDTFYKLLELLKARTPHATKGDVLADLLYIQELETYAEFVKASCWHDGERWHIQSADRKHAANAGQTRLEALAAFRVVCGW